MDMGLRVWQMKLSLVLHIRSLSSETLARRLYEEQIERGWPGLAKETAVICSKLGVEDCNTTCMNTVAYKKVVILACWRQDENRLRDQATGKEKCEKIFNENYGKKKYFSHKTISEVRQFFKTRVRMQPFAGNFSHDRRFYKTNVMCRCRESREEEQHIMLGRCPMYQDIREKYSDLSDDSDLVKFFNEVLERRSELDGETTE